MLCDVYFGNGQPMPLDGRGLMRRVLGDLAEAGYDYLAGIEIEYYIVRLDSDRITPENAGFTPVPPDVSVFERGYQYLSEVRLDSVGSTIEAIRDALWEVGLPPRAMEDEWGPGQLEFSFAPLGGLAAAACPRPSFGATRWITSPLPACVWARCSSLTTTTTSPVPAMLHPFQREA